MNNFIKLKENERIDDLEINDLKIIQNENGFCFGIDSILLSDFAKTIKAGTEILDLGTGTAILPILLTAKTCARHIVGVELQKDVAEMAKRSIKMNGLEDKIDIINEDIKDLTNILPINSYDAIVTNPPYMKLNTGLENESIEKLISRHEVKCTIGDIARVSTKLLKDRGEIYMVHRPDRLMDIIECFRKYKLEIKNMRLVFPKTTKEANLVLIKAVKNAQPFMRIQKPLYVYEENGEYTKEIKKIYNKN